MIAPHLMNDPVAPDVDRRPKVLIAEDVVETAEILRDFLELKGFDVVAVSDGSAALEQAAADPPDVIYMDVQMPGLDGIEATRRLRASDQPELSRVPIVLGSADVTPEAMERCLNAGSDEFVTKPIRLTRLTELLARLVQEGGGR